MAARASREKKVMERFAPPEVKADADKHAIYEVSLAPHFKFLGVFFPFPNCLLNSKTKIILLYGHEKDG